MTATAAVERGRESYAKRAWVDAHESLSEADRATPLGADDLELLARSAYMLGRDDDYVAALERAHRAHLDADHALPAARCAFWIGLNLFLRGETAPATGWFARAQRLVDREGGDCAERGYVLTAVCVQQMAARDYEAAYATAGEAAAIGERCGDRDLVAFARMDQGSAMLSLGRTDEGRRLVDETMVSVTAGELSPIAAGLVYCNTISFCQDAHELRRAREWTAALTRWCEQQPDMVAHTGICHVHRAELMTLGGAWEEALGELRRLGERLAGGMVNQRAMGQAAYQQGEVLRLRGEFDAAEAAYREASRLGREPQPGLALLRLAQGNVGAAAASIRRAVGEAAQPLKRAALLPAYVEIALAAEDVEAARVAWRELEEIAGRQRKRRAGGVGGSGRGRGQAGRGGRGRRARRDAPRLESVGGAQGPVRGRARPGAGGPGLPGAGRRGHGRARARGSAAGLHRAGGGSRPGSAQLAHRASPSPATRAA